MEWLPKAKIFVPAKNIRPFFSKNAPIFKAATLLYQNSLARKKFMKLKKTQLFYLLIKLMKPFDEAKTCMK